MTRTLAFTVALEHSSFHNTDVVCRLLCISKELRSQVLKFCAGQLPVTSRIAEAGKATQIALWIKRHGRLLKSWHIRSLLSKVINPLLESHVSAALQEAAEESPLLLQSFSMNCSVTATLLQQLPVQYLTNLDFAWESTPTSDQRIRAALVKLTSLQELTMLLNCQTPCSIDAVMPAINALSNLTKLSLGDPVHDVAHLQQLPRQLVDLELTVTRDLDDEDSELHGSNLDSPQYAVQLGHLTALTRLATIAHDDGDLIVRQHDELPSNLKALFVADCHICQPLMQLGQLQQLSMTCSTTTKEDLQLLSQLTALTDVSLKYYDDSYLDVQHSDDAAAAWEAVPGLRSLTLTSQSDDTQLTDAVAKAIAKLTGLTEFVLEYKYMNRHTAACLQEAVQKLTALKTLGLERLQMWQANTSTMIPPSTAAAGSFACLSVCSTFASTIAGLPSLISLDLSGCQMTSEAAKVLAGASQLTSLWLCSCKLRDHMVGSFLPSMLELKSLKLSWNSKVTGICVNMIVGLTKLTQLYLCGTSMLLYDLQGLTCLTGLEDYSLPKPLY